MKKINWSKVWIITKECIKWIAMTLALVLAMLNILQGNTTEALLWIVIGGSWITAEKIEILIDETRWNNRIAYANYLILNKKKERKQNGTSNSKTK